MFKKIYIVIFPLLLILAIFTFKDNSKDSFLSLFDVTTFVSQQDIYKTNYFEYINKKLTELQTNTAFDLPDFNGSTSFTK